MSYIESGNWILPEHDTINGSVRFGPALISLCLLCGSGLGRVDSVLMFAGRDTINPIFQKEIQNIVSGEKTLYLNSNDF